MEILLLRPYMLTRQVLNVLHTLSPTDELSVSDAREIIRVQMDRQHYTWVGYKEGNPIAIGSIVILLKVGHNGGKAALIEDIAVLPEHQGKGYGLKMVEHLDKKCRQYGVYKVYLNCKCELEEFYRKTGFQNKGLYMRKDY